LLSRLPFFVRLALCVLLLHSVQSAQSSQAQSVQAQKPAVFPPEISYSLDRSRVQLPGGLEGQIDFLLVSFQPEQQKDIDTWMPLAQALQHTNFNFRWYRLPVSARENFVFRWWQNSSMRSDETDPETWHWIVPLYIDTNQFRESLQIPNERQVVALLIDRQGHVLWRASGPLTPEKRTALLAAASGQH
jgi:hypothetical protein